MLIKLIVANNYNSSDLFVTDLDNMMKRVDWESNDPKDVLYQIYEASYYTDFLGIIPLTDQDHLNHEGIRNHNQAHSLSLLLDYFQIQTDPYAYPDPHTYTDPHIYYVDLICWDRKPPTKLNTQLRILPLLQIYKLDDPDDFELSLSTPLPYKDVETREIDLIKSKLGIKETYSLTHEQVQTENLVHRVNALKEHYKKQHHQNPVLVYVKDNETTLKRALQDHQQLITIYNELWS